MRAVTVVTMPAEHGVNIAPFRNAAQIVVVNVNIGYHLGGVAGKQGVLRLVAVHSIEFQPLLATELHRLFQQLPLTGGEQNNLMPFLLEQLLSNAVKYTYEGGVTVELTDDAKVIVSDTGIGIAPEDVPRVFEKGFTGFNGRRVSDTGTDGGRATGLGLYLCKKTAHKLNVGLSVESEVGKGTTFTVDMKKEQTLLD